MCVYVFCLRTEKITSVHTEILNYFHGKGTNNNIMYLGQCGATTVLFQSSLRSKYGPQRLKCVVIFGFVVDFPGR
jgi:hypothetical protein